MIQYHVLALLLTAMGHQTPAPVDWRPATGGFQVEISTVTGDERVRRAWTQRVNTSDGYRRFLTFHQFDCSARTYGDIHMVGYLSTGETQTTNPTPDNLIGMVNVAPNTNIEAMFEMVCGLPNSSVNQNSAGGQGRPPPPSE